MMGMRQLAVCGAHLVVRRPKGEKVVGGPPTDNLRTQKRRRRGRRRRKKEEEEEEEEEELDEEGGGEWEREKKEKKRKRNNRKGGRRRKPKSNGVCRLINPAVFDGRRRRQRASRSPPPTSPTLLRPTLQRREDQVVSAKSIGKSGTTADIVPWTFLMQIWCWTRVIFFYGRQVMRVGSAFESWRSIAISPSRMFCCMWSCSLVGVINKAISSRACSSLVPPTK